jgi:UDP-glucuronate 4-epimerase
MNILITGGAGFIGSSLCDQLIEKNNLFIVDNFNNYYSTKTKFNNIRHHLGKNNYHIYFIDLTDYANLKQIFASHYIDIVIHLAAYAGVRASIDNTKDFIDSNVIGTFNVLELMKTYNVKKLIFGSSSSVYGNSLACKFNEEMQTSQPISPYAATKLACENLIYTYSHLYRIQAICLRFFTVYGPRQRPDLAIHKFASLITNNQPIRVYGNGHSERDYTYIKDIVDGIISCISYDKTNYEIINLGSDHPIKLTHMIHIISEALQKAPTLIYETNAPGDVNKTRSDNSKAERLLNFYPQTKFVDGIQYFINWFIKNKENT